MHAPHPLTELLCLHPKPEKPMDRGSCKLLGLAQVFVLSFPWVLYLPVKLLCLGILAGAWIMFWTTAHVGPSVLCWNLRPAERVLFTLGSGRASCRSSSRGLAGIQWPAAHQNPPSPVSVFPSRLLPPSL